jgi:hypothetical protein
MITLTTAPQINSVLGGTVPVQFDRLVLSPLNFEAVAQTISGTVRLSSTAAPDMAPITGRLWVDVKAGVLEVEVGQIDFYRRIKLNAGQITAVQALISTAQTSVEQGLVSLGIIAGTQTAGV